MKLNVTETDNRLKVMNELQHYLLDRHAENRQVVVFVEEAQGMPIATLEEIRLLSNLETTQNKLLQIVLFGQPELDAMIATRKIRQLKERITYSFQLAPFKGDEVKDYLNSRMRTCGYRSEDVFSASAVSVITKYSKGLLRRINILADKSLLAAYATNTHKVKASHVKIAARDSEFLKNRKFMIPVMAALIFLVLTAGFLSSVNINQGILTIQKSFATYAKTINTRFGEVAVAIKNMTQVEEDPESELAEAPGLEQPNGPEVVVVEVAESSTEGEQVDTEYLTQGSEVVVLVETVDPEQAVPVKAKAREETVTSTEESNFMDIGALIKGAKITSPSDMDDLVDDENTDVNVEEASYLPEKEDVSSVPSTAVAIGEVIAIGLSKDEFDRFQKQLLELPPEIKSGGGPGIVCDKCSSIIYRPIL